MTQRRRVLLWMAVGLIVTTIVAVYAWFDPTIGFFPRCPIKVVTGLDCPGCGSQRALHALLHGDVVAAFRYNLLVVPALCFLALIIISNAYRQRLPRLFAAVNSPYTIGATLAIIVVWTIVRNVFLL